MVNISPQVNLILSILKNPYRFISAFHPVINPLRPNPVVLIHVPYPNFNLILTHEFTFYCNKNMSQVYFPDDHYDYANFEDYLPGAKDLFDCDSRNEYFQEEYSVDLLKNMDDVEMKKTEDEATGLGCFDQLSQCPESLSFALDQPDLLSTSCQTKQAEIPPPPKLPRSQNILELTSSVYCKHSKAGKGQRFQTKNLCKHLHTETARQLKSRAFIHQFIKEEVELIQEFCSSKISIESFKNLLKNARINTRVRSFYESRYFIKEIMSSRMEMRAKLTMVKYLEKIRSLTYDKDIKAWKE